MYLILLKFLSAWIPNKIMNIKKKNYEVISIPEIIQQTGGKHTSKLSNAYFISSGIRNCVDQRINKRRQVVFNSK